MLQNHWTYKFVGKRIADAIIPVGLEYLASQVQSFDNTPKKYRELILYPSVNI